MVLSNPEGIVNVKPSQKQSTKKKSRNTVDQFERIGLRALQQQPGERRPPQPDEVNQAQVKRCESGGVSDCTHKSAPASGTTLGTLHGAWGGFGHIRL